MNLGIIIGVDGKLNTLQNTLKVCSPVCKTIVICDTGNWIINPNIKSIVMSYPNTKYVLLNYKTEFILFDARVAIADNLPNDEWCLHIDADERPSHGLLQDWRKITNKLESTNTYMGLLPGLPHFGGKRLNPSIETIEKCDPDQILFCKLNIIKHNSSIKAVHRGNHTNWAADNGRYLQVGHHFLEDNIYYYIHAKTWFQKINGHIMCAHNIYDVNWGIESENREGIDIVNLNKKYGLEISNDIPKYILYHNDYPDEILDKMFNLGCNSHHEMVAVVFGTWALYMKKLLNKITDEQYKLDVQKFITNLSTNIHPHLISVNDIKFDQSLSIRDRYLSLLNEETYCGHRCCTYGGVQL